MDVLILGWSDIVRRRVLPALTSRNAVDAVHLATLGERPVQAPVTGEIWAGPDSIGQALAALPDALVYVSGINTDHAPRVDAALRSGHHVIVDKPAFLDRVSARHCLDLAMSRGLLLTEATVWSWHAQVRTLVDLMEQRGWTARQVRSTFTIPALPLHNFRTDPRRGGGVVADMAAYALSPGRALGGGDLVSCQASDVRIDGGGLDVAVTVDAAYRSGLQVHGTFSIDAEYANRLEVSGVGWHAVLTPAFSSKPDAPLTVAVTAGSEDFGFTAAPSDPFAAFLEAAISTGPTSPERWTATTAASIGDTLRLAAACGLGWGDPRGVD